MRQPDSFHVSFLPVNLDVVALIMGLQRLEYVDKRFHPTYRANLDYITARNADQTFISCLYFKFLRIYPIFRGIRPIGNKLYPAKEKQDTPPTLDSSQSARRNCFTSTKV